MAIKIGDTFPNTPVTIFHAEQWQTIPSHDLFANKRTILFAFPGAFTPTCTNQHLPGFLNHLDEFKAKGIDQIIGLSVNDRFVLEYWASFTKINGRIALIADGNGALTSRLNMELDLLDLGLGIRSKRYTMIINDNIISHMSLEEAGKCDLSSAENLLKLL